MSLVGSRDHWRWLAQAARRQAPVRARAVSTDDAGVWVALARGVAGLIRREELPFLAGRPHTTLAGATLRAVVTRADPERGAVELSARVVHVERCRRALRRGSALRGRVVAAGEHGLLLDLGGARGHVAAAAVRGAPRLEPGARWRGKPAAVTDHLCVLAGGADAPAGRGTGAIGGVVSGVVESLAPEGAWVRLEGRGHRRALAAYDELGWTPRPRVEVGASVAGAVLDFTMSGPRISLRALQPDPWPAIALELPPGTAVTATVLETGAGGALVRLADQPHVETIVPAEALPAPVWPGVRLRARVERVDAAAARLEFAGVRTGPAPPRGPGAATA